MAFITEWITNIILFVLLATVIDMLLPNSNLQKYTKLVTGLLLIAIILTPIFKFISNDFEETLASLSLSDGKNKVEMENLIEMKKKEIQAEQNAYILETMAVQLKKEAQEELINQYGVKITTIDFLIDEQNQKQFPENVKKITVNLVGAKHEDGAVAVVKRVEINTEQPLPEKKRDNQGKIAGYLAKKWNIKKETIEVMMEEGGKRNQDG